MSSRPGKIKAEWSVDSERPRDMTSDNLRQLDEELTKSFNSEEKALE